MLRSTATARSPKPALPRMAASSALPPLVEPWPELYGGSFSPGHGAAANPDPLRDYIFNLSTFPADNVTLMLTRVLPIAAEVNPLDAFAGDQGTLVDSMNGSLRALNSGTLRVDFGVELAGWIELRSSDLAPAAVAAGCVSMSVGESNIPQYFSPTRLSPRVKNASSPIFRRRPSSHAGRPRCRELPYRQRWRYVRR